MRRYKLIVKGLGEIHRIRPGLMCITIVNAIINVAFPFINIYMSSILLNAIVSRTSMKTLIRYTLLTVLLNAACGLIASASKSWMNFWQSEFSKLYEWRLAQKTIDLDFKDLENPETFQKKQRIDEIRNLNSGGLWKLLESFPKIINSGATCIVALALTSTLFFTFGTTNGNGVLKFVCSPAGSISLFILIIASIILEMYTNSAVTKKMYSIMNGFVSFNRIFSYYIEHYISTYHAGKDIRLYNQKGLINAESNALFGEANRTFTRLSRNQIRYSGIKTAASVAILAAIYLFVGLRALAGLFGVGNILLYINSIQQFIRGIQETAANLSSLRVNHDALQAYFDYMEIEPDMQTGQLPIAPADHYDITFCDVSFRYPGTEQDVLKHVSFTVRTGEKTALVGVNGSGKSTIVKLICRLYDPTEGKILLNGVDIRLYRYEDYISLFGIVFQDYKLLAFPLGQNVATSIQYKDETVLDCLKKVGFGGRLAKMDTGLDTPLYKDFDEDGVEISGGEAQKIAIARALYKNSPFIIMDEPTAALDPIAEAEIYENLNGIVGNKTAIFISHRLSSCRFCHRIMVFSGGTLMQTGTHDRLLEDKNGTYYSLWEAQAQYYT